MSVDEKSENISLNVENPPSPPKSPKTAPIPITNQEDKGLSHNDKIDLILNRLNDMEQRFSAPKEKTKRKASSKQLEVLAKAREARKANMSKRKEIKENMKIEEKKVINEKLKEEKEKSNPKVEENVKPVTENVVVERTPNKPTNFNNATRNTPITRENNIRSYEPPPQEETRAEKRNRLRNSLNFK